MQKNGDICVLGIGIGRRRVPESRWDLRFRVRQISGPNERR